MGPGAPRILGITVVDRSEYAALLYPAAYALVVYALQGKKGGFWLSLAAVAPFALDRKSTRLNSSHITRSRMPSSA